MTTPPAQEAFSLYNMFFGPDFSCFLLVEIIARTGIIYVYTLFNIRIFRTRNVAQLTLSDLIIVIALGTAVGDPMMYTNVPLIHAMISITTIVMFTKLIAVLVESHDGIEKLIEGEELLVIRNGEIITQNMKKANLTLEELFARLRLKGIKNTGEVNYAFLETSGLLSIIKTKTPTEGLSTYKELL
jgi:uncharacterized membrane protein YcaP (DUF421 family)